MAAPEKFYVTNHHTTALEFNITSSGSDVVMPDETKHIPLANPESPQIQAWKHVGMVSVSKTEPKKDTASEVPTEGVAIAVNTVTGGPDASAPVVRNEDGAKAPAKT